MTLQYCVFLFCTKHTNIATVAKSGQDYFNFPLDMTYTITGKSKYGTAMFFI